MMQGLRNWFDAFRGAGEHSISVPPMDGALRSNSALEAADLLLAAPSPANLVQDGADLWFSSGPALMRLSRGAAEGLARFDSSISALAAHGGALAIGLAGGGVRLRGGTHDGKVIDALPSIALNCPVALAFRDADTLLVANGSDKHCPEEWRHDLLRRNARGSVLELDLRQTKATVLGEGLSWPYGLLTLPDGGVLVSESWKARLVLLRPGQRPEPVLTDLPAYPARLVPKADGSGAWLPMFAPRRRIVELVMRDAGFRETMIAEIEPSYWISPSLRPMESYYEPLQGGTLKRLAMLKPWAPSRSYGLVVELDAEFQPIRSFHSRADGKRHGIAACVQQGDRLILAATGGDCIVSLPLKEASA